VITVAEPELAELGKYRRLSGSWRVVSIVLPAISIYLILNYVFVFRAPFMVAISFMFLLLSVLLPLCFIWVPATKRADRDKFPWYDILLAVLSFGIPFYFTFRGLTISVEAWASLGPEHAVILCAIFWGVLVEAARRAAGPILACVVLFFSLYPLFAESMPGPLSGMQFPITKIITYNILSTEAMLGIVWRVTSTLFAAYIIFAVFIKNFGAGRFFMDIATAILGKTRGGYAKVAVVTSSLFGSISGSATSNVLTTGVFTIPAMKKEGFTPEYAAGVEATASTGGTLMPPIMGAVAFIMAEFLAIPYAEVVLVAIIPSLLYYTALFAQVDAHAARTKMKPLALPAPKIWTTLLDNLHIVLGMLTLICLLLVMRLERWAPWFAVVAILVIAVARKKTRPNLAVCRDFLIDMGRTMGELTGILAPIGLILGSLAITGVSFSFPYAFVGLAGGNIYLMLVLGAAASFVLGMGLTVSACYIFLAIVVAPGLVAGGFDLLAAHLFVLYCGLMSFITPPVALSSMVAASVARADFWKTALRAMRLGIGVFLVPFFFVLDPAMILRGSGLASLQVIPTAAIGLILIGGAVEGYLWRIGEIDRLARVLVFAGGLLLAIPNVGEYLWTGIFGEIWRIGTITDVIGAALVAVTIGGILLRRRTVGGSIAPEK